MAYKTLKKTRATHLIDPKLVTHKMAAHNLAVLMKDIFDTASTAISLT